MSKMQVFVVLEFDDVEPGSPDDEAILKSVWDACENMRVGFDAQKCHVDHTRFQDDRGVWHD